MEKLQAGTLGFGLIAGHVGAGRNEQLSNRTSTIRRG
jgi:hypothetical protein